MSFFIKRKKKPQFNTCRPLSNLYPHPQIKCNSPAFFLFVCWSCWFGVKTATNLLNADFHVILGDAKKCPCECDSHTVCKLTAKMSNLTGWHSCMCSKKCPRMNCQLPSKTGSVLDCPPPHNILLFISFLNLPINFTLPFQVSQGNPHPAFQTQHPGGGESIIAVI